ncbi:MAG: phosphatase PAP2 family protein [Bacteroidales bacterium]|nr:phosphatase PAP2 family protein [Bacteroidales bacterium]
MEQILTLDTEITLYINNHYSEFWDAVMEFFSEKYVWLPLYALFIYGTYKVYLQRTVFGAGKTRKNRRFWFRVIITVAACCIATGLADYISVHCFKDVFERLRPCREPLLEGLLRPHGCGGMYGFVSSHAANVFTLAAFLTPLFQRYRIVRFGGIYLWAAAVGYSRIYLGWHYFGDVVCGALLGILLGTAIFHLQRLVIQRLR